MSENQYHPIPKFGGRASQKPCPGLDRPPAIEVTSLSCEAAMCGSSPCDPSGACTRSTIRIGRAQISKESTRKIDLGKIKDWLEKIRWQRETLAYKTLR